MIVQHHPILLHITALLPQFQYYIGKLCITLTTPLDDANLHLSEQDLNMRVLRNLEKDETYQVLLSESRVTDKQVMPASCASLKL